MMTTNENERFSYHPDPLANDADERRSRRGRRVANRRDAIEKAVPLDGRSVVDFGCSGGYFGFSWATRVASYRGIDGDAELIARNTRVAAEKGLGMLTFEHADITPNFIRALPEADVGIFLSVFHHIQAVSSAYAWNQPRAFDPIDILRAMRERLGTLVFETGYPNEGFEWCQRLPPMHPTPRHWVEHTLRAVGFKDIKVLTPGEIHGDASVLRSRAAHALRVIERPRALTSRVFQRLVRHDPRDDRDIFVAR